MVWPAEEIEAAELRLDAARTRNFEDLIKIAGLDPQQHLRFADWSGVGFSGCDLSGFDFTGARLRNCNFKGAFIKGARFDQAEIDGANLREAKDWEFYAKSWRRAERLPADDHLPTGAVFQDAPFAPEMVAIPPGRFLMGSPEGEGYSDEHPRHEVTIPNALAVGRYPVTFEEWDFAQGDKGWKKVSGLKPRKAVDESWGRERRPVIGVSWEDGQAYCRWLSEKTGEAYRLLSEAEWEYACRAGSEAAYCFGEKEEDLDDYGWSYRNSSRKTHPAGEKKANAFGLHDVHGNVWEWCEDVWHDNYGAKPDELKVTGGAWTTGDGGLRVLRGGSWYNGPRDLRAARRNGNYSGSRIGNAGFRVARTLIP